MHQVAQEDVLRALKKFKRLAKQDLLASQLMADPEFWEQQAIARRAVYEELMLKVENEGVEPAYREAKMRYLALPLLASDDHTNPKLHGEEQALEMFFTILGVSSAELDEWRALRAAGGADGAAQNAGSINVSGEELAMGAGGA
ncbi:MAG: hypothetical protein IMX00_07280 [Limnochordales bacterium]|nr:hypothetical protein [Limnochordales bacterium]